MVESGYCGKGARSPNLARSDRANEKQSGAFSISCCLDELVKQLSASYSRAIRNSGRRREKTKT